jgi:RNA polymerase sigma-70 factor (ECF subfamily)
MNTTLTTTSPAPQFATDELLLEGLLASDPQAWREFNRRYSRLIHSCIGRVMNRFSTLTTADDVLEVYSMLCVQLLARNKHKLRTFDASKGSKLGTWLGMLATHAAYDLLRSKRRTPATEELDAATPVRAQHSEADVVCDARQQAERIAELLEQFSEKDRRFFRLYFQEGLEPERVAELMGISVKTVYSKKHKLRARLETALEQCDLAA